MGLDPSIVWDFAGEVVGRLTPVRRSVPATVTRVDPDGTVWATTGDGTEAPAASASAGVEPGDVVDVEWAGASMRITGNASDPAPSGSVTRRLTQHAQAVANAASKVANAVNQHFFADGNGIHVTASTQEDWEQSHTGPNVLINSVGQLFRDGLVNLLTLTTDSGSRALTVWDGLGNTAEHVRAVIGETITLGNTSGNHLRLDGDDLRFLDDEGNKLFHVDPYDGGTLADSHVVLDTDTGWLVMRAGGLASVNVGDDYVLMYVGVNGAPQSALFADGTEVRVYQPLYADGQAYASYQVVVEGTQNSIALRANTAGNRGLYDVTKAEWVLYRRYSDDKLVISVPIALTPEEDYCTVESGATEYNVNVCRNNGACCSVTLSVDLNAALASGSTLVVATVPDGFRPPHAAFGSLYTTGTAVTGNVFAMLGTNGQITLNNRSGGAIGTSTHIYMSFTFAM